MSPRALPALTHLQFIVIGALLSDEQSGKDVRRELLRHGVRRTTPAFYQMMARLEDAGWVDGFYTQEVVDAQIIKERRYRVTPAGGRHAVAALLDDLRVDHFLRVEAVDPARILEARHHLVERRRGPPHAVAQQFAPNVLARLLVGEQRADDDG